MSFWNYLNLFHARWWKWVLFIDVFFIFVTICFSYNQNLLILQYFSLNSELNLGTWWSQGSLLVAALSSYEIFCLKKVRNKWSWLIISILLFSLSLDEIGSLHERIILSYSDYYLYGTIGITLLTYSLLNLSLNLDSRQTAFFILLGFIVFGSVAFQEYLEHSLDWADWLKGIRAGVEESSEIFGIFLCLIGISLQKQKQNKSYSLLTILPNTKLMNLSPILFSGLVIHFFSSSWMTQLSDLPKRGNPALWYPSALLIVFFCDSLYSLLNSPKKQKKWVFFLISFFLLSATIACYRYPLEPLSKLYLIYVILLLTTLLYIRTNQDNFKIPEAMWIFCLQVFLMLGFLLSSLLTTFIIFGIFMYLMAQIILSKSYANQ